jgi:tetratricopeptide (TPR) repeat protein
MVQNAMQQRAEVLRAAEQAREKIRANPHDASAHRALGRALRLLGADAEASEAELDAIDASRNDPEIWRAAEALSANDLPSAEGILRSILALRPDDVAAIRMLAEVAIHTAHPRDAEKLLRHALKLAPDFEYARLTLAVALDQLSLSADALQELDRISGPLGDRDETLALKASTLSKLGEHDQAIAVYRELARRDPHAIHIWLSIGDLLRYAGDQPGAVDSYRRALEIEPASGAAWWSLADLKTFEFSEPDVAAMQVALRDEALVDGERCQLHFAIGKALEDLGRDEASFEHYCQGNRIRARGTAYDAAAGTRLVEEAERLFTADFLDARRAYGCRSDAPIFIVGLTRSGSSLIEQILASHSMIEGTGELPDIILLAKQLEQASPGGADVGWRNYPRVLANLSAGDALRLGETYLERTRSQRKTDRPFFIDKMPNNWFHIGLIRLILPNARIIDARRHPLACGFSNFKQHYAVGQEFTYDLERFGLYYRDYVRLMGHFDRVCPGSVHRVIHERLLADPEAEIRRLLEFLDLPFEEACLTFHETKRAVRTVSSEQVRRPIDAERVDRWKRFEQWLGPLKQALGRALDVWDCDAPADDV